MKKIKETPLYHLTKNNFIDTLKIVNIRLFRKTECYMIKFLLNYFFLGFLFLPSGILAMDGSTLEDDSPYWQLIKDTDNDKAARNVALEGTGKNLMKYNPDFDAGKLVVNLGAQNDFKETALMIAHRNKNDELLNSVLALRNTPRYKGVVDTLSQKK